MNQQEEKEKRIQWAIHYLKGLNVKVAPSKVHGVGLFALRDLPKDSVVMTFSYREFPCVEVPKSKLKEKLSKETYSQIIKNWAETETGVILPLNGQQQIHYVNFLNHSDTPNLRYEADKYYAISKIEKDEEVTVNFRLPDYNPFGVRF